MLRGAVDVTIATDLDADVRHGVVDGAREPVRVVDRVSGRSAPVVEGHLFAIATHDPDPARSKENGLRLVALDAHGRVVAGDPDDAADGRHAPPESHAHDAMDPKATRYVYRYAPSVAGRATEHSSIPLKKVPKPCASLITHAIA